MRIGLVTADFWPNVGGVAAHVVELGRALVAQGHEIHVLTRPLGQDRAAESTLDGMRVHRPDLSQLRPLARFVLRRWLREFQSRAPFDLLHVHGLRPLPAVRGLHVPVVFTNHTSGFLQRIERSRWARSRVRKMLDVADLILAPSEQLAEATLSLGIDAPVRYIPNGVDTNRFTPDRQRARSRLGLAPDETVVLLARRLVAKNGVCVFAEAVSRIPRRGVRVVFAGDGPQRAEVESILDRTGCRGRALFLGNVPNDEMPTVYRAADISVLPSFMEATSITGLESMATGLPLVGTRVGGIPALIDHQRTGLLVDPGNPQQLAEAIGHLIEHPELRRSYGAAARDRVEREFAWPVIADRTVECYRRLLEMQHRSAGYIPRSQHNAAGTKAADKGSSHCNREAA